MYIYIQHFTFLSHCRLFPISYPIENICFVNLSHRQLQLPKLGAFEKIKDILFCRKKGYDCLPMYYMLKLVNYIILSRLHFEVHMVLEVHIYIQLLKGVMSTNFGIFLSSAFLRTILKTHNNFRTG